MPLKCTYIPRRARPRAFSESDAARVVCGTIANGASQRGIEDALVERGCWRRNDDQAECQRQRAQLRAEMLGLIEGNNATLAIATTAVGIIAAQLIALLALVRFVPLIGGPASIAVRRLQVIVARQTVQLSARRAANDAVFRRVVGL